VNRKRRQRWRGEQEKLAGLVDKREKLFENTHADLESEKANVKKISQQARNLADLVTRLDRDRTARKPEKKVVSVPSGNSRLPISGIIRTRYDEPDSFGAPSKGVSIEGREGALVVAPMGGGRSLRRAFPKLWEYCHPRT
jgi:septal ring factor EnvC (AmiA/AmiB activator)